MSILTLFEYVPKQICVSESFIGTIALSLFHTPPVLSWIYLDALVTNMEMKWRTDTSHYAQKCPAPC